MKLFDVSIFAGQVKHLNVFDSPYNPWSCNLLKLRLYIYESNAVL